MKYGLHHCIFINAVLSLIFPPPSPLTSVLPAASLPPPSRPPLLPCYLCSIILTPFTNNPFSSSFFQFHNLYPYHPQIHICANTKMHSQEEKSAIFVFPGLVPSSIHFPAIVMVYFSFF